MMGETPLWYEISERPRIAGFNHKLIASTGMILSIFIYISVIPAMFVFKPHQISLWLNPFRHKWPEQVHEWSGERCNWL